VEDGAVACRDTISSVDRIRVAFAPRRNYFAYAHCVYLLSRWSRRRAIASWRLRLSREETAFLANQWMLAEICTPRKSRKESLCSRFPDLARASLFLSSRECLISDDSPIYRTARVLYSTLRYSSQEPFESLFIAHLYGCVSQFYLHKTTERSARVISCRRRRLRQHQSSRIPQVSTDRSTIASSSSLFLHMIPRSRSDSYRGSQKDEDESRRHGNLCQITHYPGLAQSDEDGQGLVEKIDLAHKYVARFGAWWYLPHKVCITLMKKRRYLLALNSSTRRNVDPDIKGEGFEEEVPRPRRSSSMKHRTSYSRDNVNRS